MGDCQSSRGYNYLFGEADEVTKIIEEYRRQHGRNDNSPPFVSPEQYISTTINHYRPQRQPTMTLNSIPAEHHSSQESSQMINHHTQPTIQRSFCWKCLLAIPWWVVCAFLPRNWSRPVRRPPLPSNTLPPSVSEHIEDRPNQHPREERNEWSGVRERAFAGIGLSERQISHLPTIKFQHSIEDKKCMICQSDYVRGEKIKILPCTHKYHEDCIRPWLKNSKLCCVCQREVVI